MESIFHGLLADEPIQIIDDCVFFKYLVPRGEAYDKKYEKKLRKDDK